MPCSPIDIHVAVSALLPFYFTALQLCEDSKVAAAVYKSMLEEGRGVGLKGFEQVSPPGRASGRASAGFSTACGKGSRPPHSCQQQPRQHQACFLGLKNAVAARCRNRTQALRGPGVAACCAAPGPIYSTCCKLLAQKCSSWRRRRTNAWTNSWDGLGVWCYCTGIAAAEVAASHLVSEPFSAGNNMGLMHEPTHVMNVWD
jgi:hypothetical protein